jgi:hypothetical protein
MTTKDRLKSNPGIRLGSASVFNLWYKQSTFNYKFSFGCGQTEVNIKHRKALNVS